MQATRSNASITHVIYDMDGLLLNTEPFYTQVSTIIAGRFGKQFGWDVKSKMIGKRADDSAKIFTEMLELPISPAEYLEERRALLEKIFPLAEPLPGAVRLTRHLSAFRIPQAVATSSDRRHFELKTSRHKEWFEVFECFVMGDDIDVEQGKPAPDIFLLAASKMEARCSNCLVFEDSPAGVEAARAAGMFVIAVPDANMEKEVYKEAHEILGNLNEFHPNAWGLPPYERTKSLKQY